MSSRHEGPEPALPFSDVLLSEGGPAPDFDRFYFNLHAPASSPFLTLGAGVYPPTGVIDSYVCAAVGGEQRNLRCSSALDSTRPTAVGPFMWAVLEPLRAWRLRLGPNASGIEFDVSWSARTPAFATQRYQVRDDHGRSDHAHFFQSGCYEGTVHVDGVRIDVDGWLGQRDRSRGTRRVRDRLGMHLWVQARSPGEHIGFLFNEDRHGVPSHCDGAVMHAGGALERIRGVRHDLAVTDDLEITGGRFMLELESGRVRELTFESPGRGLYMAGGGFAGWQGQARGLDHTEHERWPLDGTLTPRALPIGVVNALSTFHGDAGPGIGVVEYALSRSASYLYTPTLK